MTEISAWRVRAPSTGQVDFTQMYAAHDAFVRDFTRLINAIDRGAALAAPTRVGWATVTHQLHVHHTSEDSFLWPRLRELELPPHEELIVNAMESEHAEIDPLLEGIEKAFVAEDATAVGDGIRVLHGQLIDHLEHEEEDALPLVERYLGMTGWLEFGRKAAQANGGLRGAATYLPWVLEGQPPEVRARFLGLLPAPARLLFNKVWEPAYRRRSPWTGTDGAR